MDDSKEQLIDNVLAQVKTLEAGKFYGWHECWLDVEYRMDSRGNFIGATVITATGGPHIEFDTKYNKVTGYWGNDRIERSYEDNYDVHGYLEELFNSVR